MCTPLQIFVLSYNRAAYLRECLRSILQQTFTDFTVVVLDNASDQDIKGTVDALGDTRIRLHVNATNIGPIRNGLQAFDEASSEFMMLFHDDDCMPPRMIEHQMRLLRAQPELTFVTTAVRLVHDHSRMSEFPDADEGQVEVFETPQHLLCSLFGGGTVLGICSVMYRTQVAKRCRPDTERFANICDGPLVLSLAAHGPCARLITPAYNVRVHPGQDSAARNWSHVHEMEVARCYLDVGWPSDRRGLEAAVMRFLAQNYAVRRPRVPVAEWLRAARRRDLFHWRLWLYLPYYCARDQVVRAVRSAAPTLYRRYREAKGRAASVVTPAGGSGPRATRHVR